MTHRDEGEHVPLFDPYHRQPQPRLDETLLDLLATDHFVGSRKGHPTIEDDLWNDLRAIDVEIDGARTTSAKAHSPEGKFEHELILDLLSTDYRVDKSSKTVEDVAGGALSDPYRAKTAMCVPHRSNDIYAERRFMMQEGDNAIFADLLAIDERIDGSKYDERENESYAHRLFRALLRVDDEMGQSRKKIHTTTDLDAMIAVDREIDGAAAARTTPKTTSNNRTPQNTPLRSQRSSASGLATPPPPTPVACLSPPDWQPPPDDFADVSKESLPDGGSVASHPHHHMLHVAFPHASNLHADAVSAGLTGIMSELYRVDRYVDAARKVSSYDSERLPQGKKATNVQRDDVLAVLELHRVDVMVDGFKKGLQMPLLKDVESRGNMGIFTALYKVDYEIDHAGTKNGEDDIDLAFIDPMTETMLRQHQTQSVAVNQDLTDVIELLQIDCEIDGHNRYHEAMKEVWPLFEVDRMIDGNKAAEATKADVEEILELYKVDVEIDRAAARSRGGCGHHPRREEEDVMAELFAIDRLMDGAKDRNDAEDAVASLTELLAVDREIDAAKHQGGGIVYSDLHAVPQQPVFISNGALPGTTTDPKDMKLFQDLLSTDKEIDGATDATRMCDELDNIQELYLVDVEIDRAKDGHSARPNPPGVECAPPRHEADDDFAPPVLPPGTKRSIFSSQEKVMAKSQCIVSKGLLPGMTTVVDGGEMIDGIPVGRPVELPREAAMEAHPAAVANGNGLHHYQENGTHQPDKSPSKNKKNIEWKNVSIKKWWK